MCCVQLGCNEKLLITWEDDPVTFGFLLGMISPNLLYPKQIVTDLLFFLFKVGDML